MRRVYVKFEEIEGEVRDLAPPIVYKYRSWSDKFHRALLSDQAAWFSHPFDLNDPLDVRPETIFDEKELYDPKYLEKMISSATHLNTEYDRKVVAENRLDQLKKDPSIIIKQHEQWNSNRNNFDGHGVFSTSTDPLSNHLWKEYGDIHRGYCLGLNTLDLCKQVKSGFGFVTYSDEPFVYSFIKNNNEDLDMLYLKKKRWEKEKEFRFITVGANKYSQRLQQFRPETVSEIILGANISLKDQEEILELIKSKYPKSVNVYKILIEGKNLTKSNL